MLSAILSLSISSITANANVEIPRHAGESGVLVSLSFRELAEVGLRLRFGGSGSMDGVVKELEVEGPIRLDVFPHEGDASLVDSKNVFRIVRSRVCRGVIRCGTVVNIESVLTWISPA